jgi:hypothetical protein
MTLSINNTCTLSNNNTTIFISVVMLSVVMLSVVMLIVVMLIVVAPTRTLADKARSLTYE